MTKTEFSEKVANKVGRLYAPSDINPVNTGMFAMFPALLAICITVPMQNWPSLIVNLIVVVAAAITGLGAIITLCLGSELSKQHNALIEVVENNVRDLSINQLQDKSIDQIMGGIDTDIQLVINNRSLFAAILLSIAGYPPDVVNTSKEYGQMTRSVKVLIADFLEEVSARSLEKQVLTLQLSMLTKQMEPLPVEPGLLPGLASRSAPGQPVKHLQEEISLGMHIQRASTRTEANGAT